MRNKKPTNWLSEAKRRARNIRHKALEDGIFDSFYDNCWPEVASGVISGRTVDYVSVGVNVKFGDPRSNRSRDIRAAHFVMDDDDE